MRFFATALLVAVSTPALAAPSDDLKAVISDHWQWWLRENPVAAGGRVGRADQEVCPHERG